MSDDRAGIVNVDPDSEPARSLRLSREVIERIEARLKSQPDDKLRAELARLGDQLAKDLEIYAHAVRKVIEHLDRVLKNE